MIWPLRPQPAPRSRRQWAAAAERVELVHLAGDLTVDENGGFNWMFVTCGPRSYVRRVAERFAAARGFVVTKLGRGPPPLVNPLTREPNHVYLVRLERRR